MILLMLPRDLLVFDVDESDENQMEASMKKTGGTKAGEVTGTGADTEEDALPMIDGIDWDYGLMHLRQKELLLDTVIDFYRTIDSEADYLEQCYREIDSNEDALNLYRVKVHAMKSSAALFGAVPLSGVAKFLESAAKDGRIDVIRRVTPVFLEEWRSYKEKLKICIPEEEKQQIEDISVVVELLDRLRYAMEDMDIDVSDEMMEKLRQYEFPGHMQDIIEQLGTAVVNLDSDQAIRLAEELLVQIEKREDNK